jgi:hypothetical protein
MRAGKNSDAPEILSKFRGNLVTITATKDQVIHLKVIETMYNSATKVKSKKLLML